MHQGGNLPVVLPLLAAGFDWLDALLPFLFVGVWILSQVFAVFRRLNGRGGPRPNDTAPGPLQPRRPAQRPFPGNQPRAGGPPGPGRLTGSLRKQLECKDPRATLQHQA